MIMRRMTLFLAISALVLTLLAGSVPMAHAQDNAEALFQQKCSKCHTLDRTNVTMTSEEWWTTVLAMKKKWFSGISDEDAKVIYQYLVQNRSK